LDVLTKYIVKAVLQSTGVTLVLLLALFNLFTFSDELDDIGKGSYGLVEVFYYLAYTSPTTLYHLMPASGLVGSLFALGAMANHQEITAMRAAGLSIFRIIRSILVAGLIMVMVAALVGEVVAPKAEQKAQMIRASSQKDQILFRTRYGLWLREGRQFINIRNIDDNGGLFDVSIYELDDTQRLKEVIHADTAIFQGQRGWLLQQVNRSEISTRQIKANNTPQQYWLSSIEPDFFKIAVVNPNNLSLYDLAMYVEFLKDNHQKSHRYEMALWGRIANPLVIFAMLLVSTPFVIGLKRGMGVGAKILIGAVIGLGFNIFDMTVSQIGLIYHLNPAIMAFIPSVLMSVLAFSAIRRLG